MKVENTVQIKRPGRVVRTKTNGSAKAVASTPNQMTMSISHATLLSIPYMISGENQRIK